MPDVRVAREWGHGRKCQGCGSGLPVQRGSGRPRKWCPTCKAAKEVEWARESTRRRRGVVRNETCDWCEGPIPEHFRVTRKWCCEECARARRARLDREKRWAARGLPAPGSDGWPHSCEECGDEFFHSLREGVRFCSRPCRHAAWGRTRRARKRDVDRESYSRRDVFDRDGWVCQLCDRKIDEGREYPDPLSPSVDHVVPISVGGPDTLANVQASHLECNLRKGVSAQGEQLRLVG